MRDVIKLAQYQSELFGKRALLLMLQVWVECGFGRMLNVRPGNAILNNVALFQWIVASEVCVLDRWYWDCGVVANETQYTDFPIVTNVLKSRYP